MSDQIIAEAYMMLAAEEACPGVERIEKKLKLDTFLMLITATATILNFFRAH